MTDERYPPIGDYAFLGDCHNWALVSRHGSVDWCTFENHGERTVFGRILDWDRGGHCRIWPGEMDQVEVSRAYVPDTNVLVTRFEHPDGVLELTDALVLRKEADDAHGELDIAPWHQLVRRVRCLQGRVPVRLEVRPKFDYGLTSVHVRVRDGGFATVVGGADALVVRSDLELEQDGWGACVADAELGEGDERWVDLSYSDPIALEERPVDVDALRERLDATLSFWREWVGRCTYDGPYRDEVVRSALVLKALTNSRTGAIVAAPTTSLPEEIGGSKNWDYRYVWLRDAAAEIEALYGLGYQEEAEAFADWLSRTTAGTAHDLQVMFGADGTRLLREIELPALEGYRGSSPVRVGNGAASQFQLDMYGELVNTAYAYHRHGGELSPEMCHLLADVLERVEERWHEPDKGMWEIRGAPEHFTASKMYAWAAADRLAQLAQDGVIEIDVDRALALRDRIRRYIERYGVDEDTGAFVIAFGRQGVDATALLLAIEGFVDPHDERLTVTIERLEQELGEGPMLHRYREPEEDEASGQQGAFFWCSFWLVTVHVMRGELDRAKQRFESLLELRNELGLMSEECDPDTGQLLGNFPQAISHVGLIDAALRISEAQRGQDASPRGAVS